MGHESGCMLFATCQSSVISEFVMLPMLVYRCSHIIVARYLGSYVLFCLAFSAKHCTA